MSNKSNNTIKNCNRVTLLASIGAGLEYYDFVIYAMMVSYLSHLFFPKSSDYASVIAAFAVFAVGYVVRPLGGIIFGVLGDRLGRKSALLSSMLIMGIVTFCMGLMPTYGHIGMPATIIFVLLRIIQGVSFGAEMPGTLIFITEHVAQRQRSTHCGLMLSSTTVGVALASLMAGAFAKGLGEAQMLAWGWRVPFLLGGVLAIVGYFMRQYTQETPHFTRARTRLETHHLSLLPLFTRYYKQIFIGLGILLFPTCFVMFILSMPTYVRDVYHYAASDIYFVITISYVFAALLLPPCGWLADRFGRKKMQLWATGAAALLVYVLFQVLAVGTLAALISFMLIYQVMMSLVATSYFALLAESFPTNVRYSGVAFCYNISYAIAALMPMLASFLYMKFQQPFYLAWIFGALALVNFISALFLENRMDD
jgi:MFS family permease